MEKSFITTEDALASLKIGRTTLYRLIGKGWLKRYKLGPRLIRFDAGEVGSLVERMNRRPNRIGARTERL